MVWCAGVLEERIVWAVDRQPKSLQRARANIMAGLGQLGMLTAQTCPKELVHEVEHILQVGLCCRQCSLCETKQVPHHVCMTAHVALLATSFAIQYTQSDMLQVCRNSGL